MGGSGLGLLPDFWNPVHACPSEPQRPEALPAHSPPAPRGPSSQDACWAVRPSLGHPAHQLSKGHCLPHGAENPVKAHRQPGCWSCPGSRPFPMLGAQGLLSVRPLSVGSRGCPRALSPLASSQWLLGSLALAVAGVWASAVLVCAWADSSGDTGSRKQRLAGRHPFWKRQCEAPGSLAPMCPALPVPELRSPGWDTRCLLGGQAAPGAAAQTPVSLQMAFGEGSGDAAPRKQLRVAVPVPEPRAAGQQAPCEV